MIEPKIISDASEIVLPDSFRCPICDAAIYIEDVNAWEENDDGQMKAEAVKIDCTTFPGFDNNLKFNEYMDSHWSTPYIDWLPLEKIVTQWVNERYSWNLE